jgi:hypothetical protein
MQWNGKRPDTRRLPAKERRLQSLNFGWSEERGSAALGQLKQPLLGPL